MLSISSCDLFWRWSTWRWRTVLSIILRWLRFLSISAMCMRAELLQLCPPFRYAMNFSLPGSSVHGILQARTLEWVAMPSSRRSSQPGIEPVSLMSPALASGFFITSATWEAPICAILFKNYVYWELRKIFLLRFLKMEWEWEEAFIEYLIDTGHLTYSIWPILIRALQIKLCYSFYRWRCAARNWQG